MRKNVLVLFAIIIWTNFSLAQTATSTKEFWFEVQMNYNLKQMPDGIRGWLYEIVSHETRSYTDALATLETLSKNEEMQDKIFLNLYTSNYKNKEFARLILAKMCGSYSIGNPISDYIFMKYCKDARAMKIIEDGQKKDEKNAQLEEQKKKDEEKKMPFTALWKKCQNLKAAVMILSKKICIIQKKPLKAKLRVMYL